MKNYQLNTDGYSVAAVKGTKIRSISTKTNHKRKLGFVVVSAALLTGAYTLFMQPSFQLSNLINKDSLLTVTTTTLHSKASEPQQVSTTPTASIKTRTILDSSKSSTLSSSQGVDATDSTEISHIPPNLPKYITLTKKLPLHSIETLSTNQSTAQDTDNKWKTYVLSRGDKIEKALYKLGIKSADRKALLNNPTIASQLKKLSKNGLLRALIVNGKLTQLVCHQPNNKNSFVASKLGSTFHGTYKKKVIESHQLRDTLFITNSLRYDANQAKIPRSIISQLITIFDRDVKLTRDLRKGDRLTFVYTEIRHLGSKIGDGQVLAAELIHNKRSHRAISFNREHGANAFFDEQGYDLSKAFIRRPLTKFKRISASFGMRKHPISKRYLMHTGTDFAAKRGTPIKVTGNGIIKHIARKGNYGKTIIVQHAGGYTTRYAHLSGYKKGLKPGSKVYIGDVIGYVGSTGRSTGNHLHYEFRINGKPYNPEKVKLPHSLSLSAIERQRFKSTTHNLRRQLDVLQRFVNEKVDIDSAIGG